MLYNPEWKPQVQVNPAKDLALKAAQLLRNHGHCKGATRNSRGQYCLVGALFEVTRDCDDDRIKAVVEGLRDRLGLPLRSYDQNKVNLVNWNDKYARDGAEVIAALEGVANAL